MLRLITTAALLAAIVSYATGAAGADSGASSADIDAYVVSAMESFGIPGCAVASFDADGVRYSGAFGVADASGRPVTERTPFVIGSLSKAITAYAAHALVDEGRLDLDGPANRHLSWLDPKLTIADLIGQTSGYSGRDGVDFDRRSASSTLAELVRRYESLEPRDGSSFEYSNVNYNLLGAIIERVAGRRFAAHVRAAVFDELGITCSFTDLGRARAAGLSNGYRLFFRRPFPAESLPFFDSFIPSMTMASCSADLAVFFSAILARRDAARNEWFVDPGSRAVLDGYQGSYGDGFLITRFAGERTYFFQRGYRSFRSYAFLFPYKGIGVLGLMNVNTMFFIQADLAYLMCGVAALSGVILTFRLSMLLVARASGE